MKKYFYKKNISVNMYPCFIGVIYSNDFDRVWRITRYENKDFFAFAHKSGDGKFIAVFNGDDKEDITAGDIAHEATHIALSVLQYLGCNNPMDDQEHMAYLVGHLVNEITKFINLKSQEDNTSE